MRKPYNTPHRTHVVKTRLTDEEHELFLNQCRTYGISQSEMLRQSMTRLQIKPVIHVSAVNDELLSAIGKLTAEYGRIGGNLNQIARTLNEWHSPYPQLAGEVRSAVSDLAALKFEVLEKVGEAVGNVQAYARLSKDDEQQGESLSIENQKRILETYARDNGFLNCRFFVDDGWSGANFQRPGFMEMMDCVENGEVKCVITKDLSRMGRNYLQVGMFTETLWTRTKKADRETGAADNK